MKPLLEVLPSDPESSWSLFDRKLDKGIPFQWHHHPELELTLTLNSRGQRFIGDHIGDYSDGDLVLIGPNLPHTWSSKEKLDPELPHRALVLWFHPSWIRSVTKANVELKAIDDLLDRADRGLRFAPETVAVVRPEIERLFDLGSAERLLGLLRVLGILAVAGSSEPLSSITSAHQDDAGKPERIGRVLDYLHASYRRPIRIDDIADLAALSPSGLHRLFRKHKRMTISDYVKQLRIGEACSCLAGSDRPISHIADEVGYCTLSNFNRQFKALKGMSPRDYRVMFRHG